MSNKMLLTTRLDQRLLMNQQLKQAINLLQYSTVELKQQVQQLIESNFIFDVEEEENTEEEHESPWQTKSSHQHASDDYLENVASHATLREHLLEQTLHSQFNEKDQAIAVAIIDGIDDDGYLQMTLEEIAYSLNQQDKHAIERVLVMIQEFEPKGVGARNTQECLLLQLKQTPEHNPDYDYARAIVLTNRLTIGQFDIDEIGKMTQLSEDQITAGLQIIKTLDFHPGRKVSSELGNTIEPEIYVRKIKNEWKVFLYDTIFTRLSINHEYKRIIKEHARHDQYKSIAGQLKEAQLVISAIRRRNETLLAVAHYIVSQQIDFLEQGNQSLKPMNMVDAALALEYHESTISRITTGKYITTPHGVFELKHFFPSELKSTDGTKKSSTAVKMLIQHFILQENQHQAYSDDDITRLLKDHGIEISRRTVAKYREAMNIPSSYLRAGMNILKKTLEPSDATKEMASVDEY